MTIDQAAEMLGAQHRLLQPFAVADPFHDGLAGDSGETPRSSSFQDCGCGIGMGRQLVEEVDEDVRVYVDPPPC